MGELAREIVKRPEYNAFECETLFLVGAFIDLWCKPFTEVIETFERGQAVGLAAGNHLYGYGCCYESINTSFVAGTVPLGELADTFCKSMVSVRRYNILSTEKALEPLGTPIFHLLGRRGEAAGLVIDGTKTDWDELETTEDPREDGSNHISITWQSFVRMILAYYLRETEVAERMSKKFNSRKSEVSYAFVSVGAFFSCLANVEMYRKTGKRKYKWRAQAFCSKLGKTVSNGGINNTHKHHLLQAETMAAFKTHGKRTVKEMYDRAIIGASEMGCVHDEALANELAGEYFLRRNDKRRCGDYFAKAILLYRQWQAMAKVKLLLDTRAAYINKSLLKPILSSSVKSALGHACARPSAGSLKDSMNNNNPLIFFASDELAAVMDDDMMSGLTPIGELTSYNDATEPQNRWGVEKVPSHCSPPSAPRRLRTSDTPAA